MSRVSQRSGAPALKQSSEGDGEDICPVCKSSRYLNPTMRFLINNECYHKMCESCVDRIFGRGPANCPIAGCPYTLRKGKFHQQTFADLQIEREVDIRRRLANIFNFQEEDFESLNDYNQYLNDAEDKTYNVIHNIDKAETDKWIENFKRENKEAIERNRKRAGQDARSFEVYQAAEKEQARQRREAVRQEEEDERREREDAREDIINKLASSTGDADKITREGQKLTAKRITARKTAFEQQQKQQSRLYDDLYTDDISNGTGKIRGLKQESKPEPERPYDPFGGLSDAKKYFVLQDDYDWDWLKKAKNDVQYTAGGYDVQAYCARALGDAFAGLGCFINEEVTGKQEASVAPLATAAAAQAAESGGGRDAKMDDVFL